MYWHESKTYLCKKQDGEMAIVADDDGATTSKADDDRSEIQQYHWQTDVFNNMDIDEVHKNDLFNYFSPH